MIFKGFMWAAAITLIILVMVKCCCGKGKCGKKRQERKQARIEGLDQKIDFHRGQIHRLQEMKRNQQRNIRPVNPYYQDVRQEMVNVNVNPYNMNNVNMENERISIGQRPSGNVQMRNVPVGRVIQQNEFENSYPTL